MLPLPVACVADAWLGRYRAIILASIIFVLVSPNSNHQSRSRESSRIDLEL
jgi:hypothetical protein